MKKVIMILALFVVVSGVSACRTTIDDDRVTVYTDHRDGPHDGNFCPPGHAKKGWC